MLIFIRKNYDRPHSREASKYTVLPYSKRSQSDDLLSFRRHLVRLWGRTEEMLMT